MPSDTLKFSWTFKKSNNIIREITIFSEGKGALNVITVYFDQEHGDVFAPLIFHDQKGSVELLSNAKVLPAFHGAGRYRYKNPEHEKVHAFSTSTRQHAHISFGKKITPKFFQTLLSQLIDYQNNPEARKISRDNRYHRWIPKIKQWLGYVEPFNIYDPFLNPLEVNRVIDAYQKYYRSITDRCPAPPSQLSFSLPECPLNQSLVYSARISPTPSLPALPSSDSHNASAAIAVMTSGSLLLLTTLGLFLMKSSSAKSSQIEQPARRRSAHLKGLGS